MISLWVHLFFVVFFFFSSRRRHTRWTGDWSSDVCSSDLDTGIREARRREGGGDRLQRAAPLARRPDGPELRERREVLGHAHALGPHGAPRSEERRVGKEGRARGGPRE